MTASKLAGVFRSRKFWAALIGLVVSMGLVALSDSQQAELVGAIVTVATTLSYIFGVAIEDAGRAVGSGYVTGQAVSQPGTTVVTDTPQDGMVVTHSAPPQAG
jgi:hypothetical protein